MNAKFLSFLKKTGKMVVLCVQYSCMTYCVTAYGFTYVNCGGESMEPTINTGDAFIVDTFTVYWQKLQRGDIVGFKSLENSNTYLCKRIVAFEGDKVFNTETNRYVWVPKGHVWLEGDNKAYSHDSRHFGPVPYGLLVCRLIFRIWSSSQYKNDKSRDS